MNECYNAHKVILCPEFDLAIIAPIPNLMTHFAVETNFLGEKSGDLATIDQCQTHQRQTYLFIWIVFLCKIQFPPNLPPQLSEVQPHIDKVTVGYSSDVAEVTFETSQLLRCHYQSLNILNATCQYPSSSSSKLCR